MKIVLFILVYIVFNNLVAFWSFEEYKTSTWEVVSVDAKENISVLNKNIKNAEVDQLKEIIKNDPSLKIDLIWKFKLSKLSLNDFLNNYFKESQKLINNIENNNKKELNNTNINISDRKVKIDFYDLYFKYLSLVNFILILTLILFYFYKNKIK